MGFAFFINPKSEPQIESEPSMETFEQYPLQAWQTTDINGGDCVKIRYKVQKENTRLYMINSQGKKVHAAKSCNYLSLDLWLGTLL